MARKIVERGRQLIEKTGIDFEKYRSPELVERVGNLVGFVRGAKKILACYQLLFALIIIVLCIWFYTRGMNIAGILFFFVIGILVSAATGTALGTVKLSGKVMEDSASVVGLLLDLVKQIRSDLSGLRQKQAASGTALSDLLKGLSFMVVIPAVAELIQNHLRLLAKPVKFLAENTLFYLTQGLADGLDQATRKIPAAQLTAPGEQKSAGFDQAIDEARGKIDRLAQSLIRKVTAPARLLFTLSLILGLPMLLIVYLIFA